MRSDFPKEKNPQRINDLQKIWKTNPSLYNFDGIEFPVKTSDIARIKNLYQTKKKISLAGNRTRGGRVRADRVTDYTTRDQLGDKPI